MGVEKWETRTRAGSLQVRLTLCPHVSKKDSQPSANGFRLQSPCCYKDSGTRTPIPPLLGYACCLHGAACKTPVAGAQMDAEIIRFPLTASQCNQTSCKQRACIQRQGDMGGRGLSPSVTWTRVLKSRRVLYFQLGHTRDGSRPA